jgi:hypothetical protein
LSLSSVIAEGGIDLREMRGEVARRYITFRDPSRCNFSSERDRDRPTFRRVSSLFRARTKTETFSETAQKNKLHGNNCTETALLAKRNFVLLKIPYKECSYTIGVYCDADSNYSLVSITEDSGVLYATVSSRIYRSNPSF